MGTANVTLYAQWSVLPTYTVSYNGNGSSGGAVPTDSNLYLSGATVAVLGNTGNLTKTGYTFKGWNTVANGAGTPYAAASTFSIGSANVTLYAQWTVVDTTGPTLTVSSLANNAITNNATLNISGTVSDTNGVASLKINNTAVTITNGTFSHAVTLQAGSNSIITVATDTLGNSTTDTRTITLDQTAPTLTITVPADNSKTAQPLATITGTISETSTVTVIVNNGSPQSASITGSVYSASVNLISGLNSISITATDLAGNTTSAVRTVTYDNTNPSLAITNPSQDITTAQNSITISGTVSDTITSTTISISFNGQTLTPAVTSGAFSQLLTFTSEGTWPVVVTATDEVGNTAKATRNIIYGLPANGSCGSSNGGTFTVIPSTNLCNSNSTASTITGTGPWSWSCAGTNGGTTATCSASSTTSSLTQFTVTPTTGTGFTSTPSTPQVINKNASISFTITPQSGYGIAAVSGCGGSFSGSTYTSSSITANCMVSVTAVARNASGGGSGQPPTISDALKVLQAVVGMTQLTAVEQIRYDVAPLGSGGTPVGNGSIDAADVILILRRSIGIGSW